MSEWPNLELMQLVRDKVAQGEVIDIERLIPLAQRHLPRRSHKELAQLILGLVVGEGGSAQWK